MPEEPSFETITVSMNEYLPVSVTGGGSVSGASVSGASVAFSVTSSVSGVSVISVCFSVAGSVTLFGVSAPHEQTDSTIAAIVSAGKATIIKSTERATRPFRKCFRTGIAEMRKAFWKCFRTDMASFARTIICPVSMTFTYPEHTWYTGKRAPSYSNARLACDKDGKIIAAEYDFAFDQKVDSMMIGSVTGGMCMRILTVATDATEKAELRLLADSAKQAFVVLGDTSYYESLENAMKIR